MAQPIVVRDPDPDSWPLPLPVEVVVRELLPELNRDARNALRLTSRALRLAVDAGVSSCRLRAKNCTRDLPRFVAALPRLRGLRDLMVDGLSDEQLAAFAANAVPQLHQLTSLFIGPERGAHSGAAVSMARGGAVLAQRLSCLQRLEEFIAHPRDWEMWGAAAEEVVDALARLPALRILSLGSSFHLKLLRRPCDELGAPTWRRLEELRVAVVQEAADVQALVSAPLPRLTKLLFEARGRVTNLCLAISGAPWGPQLRRLVLTLVDSLPPGALSGLAFPNLEQLELSYSGDPSQALAAERLTLEGWSLPKLQRLSATADVVSRAGAASLAAQRLPALTALDLAPGRHRRFTAPVLHALLRGAPWLPQLQTLEVHGPALGPDGPGSAEGQAALWAYLATAPLTSLTGLWLTDCRGMDAAGGAALGGAPWLWDLQHLILVPLRAEALTGLRDGSGGFSALEAAGWLKVERASFSGEPLYRAQILD